VFIDTHSLLAIVNADDLNHEPAVAVLSEMIESRTPLLTSDWIIAEFLSACSKRPLRSAGLKAVDALRASPLVRVVPANRATFDLALRLYRARSDKDWSLIDCTSMILCKQARIRRVFTGDHHFVQAGFEVLLDASRPAKSSKP
jgi:hypothetical protein